MRLDLKKFNHQIKRNLKALFNGGFFVAKKDRSLSYNI